MERENKNHNLPIKWGSDVPKWHKNLVESGRFDLLPKLENFSIGIIIVTRFSNRVYKILGSESGKIVAAHFGKTCHRIGKFEKDDIRSWVDYRLALDPTMQTGMFPGQPYDNFVGFSSS